MFIPVNINIFNGRSNTFDGFYLTQQIFDPSKNLLTLHIKILFLFYKKKLVSFTGQSFNVV